MKFARGFKYNGHSSYEKDLIIVNDSDSNDYNIGLEREIITGNTNHARYEAFGLSAKYSSMLEISFTVIKNPDYHISDVEFTREEVREVTAWLTSPTIPMLLSFDDPDEDPVLPVDYFGNFTNVQSFTARGVYGLKLTFLCSSPWGYSREYVYSSIITESGNLTIENTSDDWNVPVYPYITIVPAEHGQITIENITDNGSFSFNCERNVTTYIDCRRLMVSDDTNLISFRDLGWTTNTLDTLYWPRLIHGTNKFKITGNCTIEMKCRFPRKVGEV